MVLVLQFLPYSWHNQDDASDGRRGDNSLVEFGGITDFLRSLGMGQEYIPLSKHWERPCSRCGDLIKEGDPNITIDTYSQEKTNLLSTFAKVWHKACYDQDLEDGESSD